MMKCSVIRDLLPSYIDGVCSQDTTEIVEEHLQSCEECRKTLNMMQQQLKPMPILPEEEMMKAKMPFQAIKKKVRIQLLAAILVTAMLTVIGYQVVQNVGSVHNVFFPQIRTTVNFTSNMEKWERLSFDGKEYLVFDSIFFKKVITNHANNEADLVLRIKDADGNILIDHLEIFPGRSADLGALKNNEKYIVEMKGQAGKFFITVS